MFTPPSTRYASDAALIGRWSRAFRRTNKSRELQTLSASKEATIATVIMVNANVQTAASAPPDAENPSPSRVRGGTTGWARHIGKHARTTHTESLQALLAAVDAKDPYTRSHSLRVAAYADAVAKRMDRSVEDRRTLQAAALLHDVGKIGVPDRILTKPGRLTSDEFDMMRRHPQIALDILAPMKFLAQHRPLILHHHERYDGTGYPDRLVGEHIPLGARILSVVDAIDTMLSPRSYKSAFTLDDVRAELIAGSGKQFDPRVVGVALDWLDETPPLLRHIATRAQSRSATGSGRG